MLALLVYASRHYLVTVKKLTFHFAKRTSVIADIEVALILLVAVTNRKRTDALRAFYSN